LVGRLIFNWAVWASSRTREPGTKSTNIQVEVRIFCILYCYYVVVDYYAAVKKIMKGIP